ncbi:MAG: DUF3787 domain-containing protein [Clostridiales bacterium]|nr:DUF3787 domain-containing protein [Clostridiales bacterium]
MKLSNNKGEDKKKKDLGKISPTNREGTAAWQNFEGFYKVDQVGKPSEEDVIEAKDWVDNGSKL